MFTRSNILKSLLMISMFLVVVIIAVPAKGTTLSNGVYDVLVAIKSDTPHDATLVGKIKTMMTDASKYLWVSLKEQGRFGKVTILVPANWPDDPSYLPTTGETEAGADILVKTGGGAYASGSKIYIGITSMSGDTVVHEWGHARFGLGDEYCDYVLKADGWHQVYKTTAGWNRCTALQEIERDCEERLQSGAACSDTKNNVNGAKASIMHRQWNTGIDSWCDKVTDTKYQHNATVNNHQNRKHGNKSCWEVINAHGDGFKSTGGTKITYSDPTFEVKKAGKAEIILVLDVSGSMSGTPIQNAAAAARNFVNQVETGSWVGVVQFDDTATLLLGLTEITNTAARTTVKAAIPTTDSGGNTSIGAGMQTALTALNASPRSMSQYMVLLTDGAENTAPMIADVLPSVVAAKVTVNSIGLGSSSDAQMMDIADQTNGTYFYAPSGDQLALTDAFNTIANSTNSTASVTVQSTSSQVSPGGIETVTAIIDDTVGEQTVFNFTYSGVALADIYIYLTQPDGTVLNHTYAGYSTDATSNSITYNISGTAQSGAWTATIRNNGSAEATVTTTVSSASSAGEAAITMTVKLNSSDVSYPDPVIIAASLSSSEPIINANVRAWVTNPDGTTTMVWLLDNGQGADANPMDGTYSAYYVGYVSSGNYSVKVTADNSSGVAEVGSQFEDGGGVGSQSDLLVEAYDGDLIDSGDNALMIGRKLTDPAAVISYDFQRTVAGGGFSLSSYYSTDMIPPGRISTLSVVDQNDTGVTLTWTAVGDDLDSGTATSYDLRTSQSPITTDDEFNAATSVPGVGAPKVAGSFETYTVTGLNAGTSYYFAIKAIDEAGNASELSNVYNASTSGSGGGGGGGGGGCFIKIGD